MQVITVSSSFTWTMVAVQVLLMNYFLLGLHNDPLANEVALKQGKLSSSFDFLRKNL